MREDILVGYEDVNIFRIYFPMEKKIERVRELLLLKSMKATLFLMPPLTASYLKKASTSYSRRVCDVKQVRKFD